METHHKKHHQTYVTNLNNALTQLQEAQHKGDLAKQIQLQAAVNFNGGGHLNHSIFWTNLAPKAQGGGSPPTGDLAKAIEEEFGGVSQVQSLMTAACLGIQGSGWGWLAYHPTQQRLQVITRANQDPVVDAIPLLGIDVWEHVRALTHNAHTATPHTQMDPTVTHLHPLCVVSGLLLLVRPCSC